MNKELAWLSDLKGEVIDFLNHQKSVSTKGYFRYSFSGDNYDSTRHWNVGSSVFALKLYYVLGIEKDQNIKDIATYIKSFLHDDGLIYDDFIHKKGLFRNLLASIKNNNLNNLFNTQYKMAETRQSYSVLLLYDELPQDISFDFPKDENEIDSYLSKLNWSEPWGAGSHFSHLMFFYRLAYESKNIDEEKYNTLVDYAISWVNKLQHEKDGGWYRGKQEHRYVVNGAMKILTGLTAVDRTDFRYAKELIDTCLIATNDIDACDNFNIIYVLNYASKLLDRNYRQDKIEDFALNRLAKYKAHYKKSEGGFSFFTNQANTRYFGVKITKGHNESDIHGTVLFMWGISIIVQILGIEDEFNFNEFMT